jgi:UDP-glucose 4-epimerase
MKVVITGANGFIGRALARRLVARNVEVVGVVRQPQETTSPRFVTGGITKPGPWQEAFAGAQCVFHLAGKAHALAEVSQDESEYFRVNTEATKYVLEAAKLHGVPRFVLFSSTKAMSREDDHWDRGRAPLAAWDESSSVAPDTPYGRSKLLAEQLVLSGGYVREPVVLRPSMVYGPGGKGNLEKLLSAVDGGFLPRLPDVSNKRSMVHVEDLVTAALLASEHDAAVGGIFIVTDGHAYSTSDIQSALYSAVGRKWPRWTLPMWSLRALATAGDSVARITGRRFVFDSASLPKLFGSAWYSSQKISTVLGYGAEWDLARALPEMVYTLRNRRTKARSFGSLR